MSVKKPDLDELRKFQIILTTRFGRMVGLSETLKIAVHIATTNLDDEYPTGE